jgi:threonine dehydrogenase-like Zn-dependent dehydrogenase
MGVAGAALNGAARIIAVGSRPNTLELARHYGVTDTVDSKKGPILDQILAANGGEPADSVLLASGGSASEMFTTALRAVKYGGHVANVSGFLSEETVTIPLEM